MFPWHHCTCDMKTIFLPHKNSDSKVILPILLWSTSLPYDCFLNLWAGALQWDWTFLHQFRLRCWPESRSPRGCEPLWCVLDALSMSVLSIAFYLRTADLRSWGLQKFHAMTMFGEITQEPMETSGEICSDPTYHCESIQITHAADESTIRGTLHNYLIALSCFFHELQNIFELS